MVIREALVTDIPEMHVIRLAVKENMLSNPEAITPQDYIDFLTLRGKGWVGFIDESMAGFAVVDLLGHNVWALFVHPEYEGRGLGKMLHHQMLDWYFTQTKQPLWLGTSPNTRAEEFYRRRGWREIGLNGSDEIKFELDEITWNKSR